jgi:hypothetical protein
MDERIMSKDGKPDLLLLAFQNFISDYPDSWDGETLFNYFEDSESDTVYTNSKVSIWEPLDGMDKEIFLDAVDALHNQFIAVAGLTSTPPTE